MINKLKTIYKNKIIENVTAFDYDNYYYFYLTDDSIFGIEKTISTNEYELIKTVYIEKIVYSQNLENQFIGEYLYENKKYPFKKKCKLIIINDHQKDLIDIMLNFYKEVKTINFDNMQVFFCFDFLGAQLEELSTFLSFELGRNLKIHDGIYIDDSFEGKTVLNYLILITQFINKNKEEYTDISSPIIKYTSNITENYANFIYSKIISKLFSDVVLKDIVLTYFKTDLNVSQTAKTLYINRNSLLNKFENIYKETGFNLQKFSHACALYIFTQIKG